MGKPTESQIRKENMNLIPIDSLIEIISNKNGHLTRRSRALGAILRLLDELSFQESSDTLEAIQSFTESILEIIIPKYMATN